MEPAERKLLWWDLASTAGLRKQGGDESDVLAGRHNYRVFGENRRITTVSLTITRPGATVTVSRAADGAVCGCCF